MTPLSDSRSNDSQEAPVYRCPCVYCEMSRALAADPLDREQLERAYDGVFNRAGRWEAEYAHLFTEVWDSIKAGDVVPERIAEAFRIVAKGTAADPEYMAARKRYRVVAAPTFVEQYADLTDRTKSDARRALKGMGIEPHLVAAPEERSDA